MQRVRAILSAHAARSARGSAASVKHLPTARSEVTTRQATHHLVVEGMLQLKLCAGLLLVLPQDWRFCTTFAWPGVHGQRWPSCSQAGIT